MRVLVSDTSVVIDLDRGGLLESAFTLPLEFAVSDLLFQRELRDKYGERLLTLGLRVEELNPQELSRAMSVVRQHRRLSAAAAFAYAIAEARRWPVLTGDADLRLLSEAAALECHGVLWLFDQFEVAGVVHRSRLRAGLKAISDHPRCRLPVAEVRRRLNTFSA